jgi:4-oxalocrotonate tautomerase
MPIIQVNMIEGRTVEQKRALVSEITKVVCKCINTTSDRVTVIINDIPKTNLGNDGKLRIDQ